MESQRSKIPFQRLLILKRKVSRCTWDRNASGAALSTCMISLGSQFSMCLQTKGTQKLPKRESSQKRRAGTAGDFLQSTRRGTPGLPTQLPNCSFCKCGGRPRPPSIGSQNGLWIPETLMGSGSSGGSWPCCYFCVCTGSRRCPEQILGLHKKRHFLSSLPKAASETTKPAFYLLSYGQKMAGCFYDSLIFRVKICNTVSPGNFSSLLLSFQCTLDSWALNIYINSSWKFDLPEDFFFPHP